MSPGRSVGSPEVSTRARPSPSLPLQEQLSTDLVAIGEGVVEIGIARAVRRDRGVDLAAGEHHGLGRRAERLAQLGRRRAGMALQREIAAVAGAHAVDRAVAEAAGLRRTGAARRRTGRADRRRNCSAAAGSGARRWKPPPNSASNRPCAAAGWTDAGEAKRQCGEQNAADTADRAAIGDSHGRLPTPGTDSRGGVPINAALQERLQRPRRWSPPRPDGFNPAQSSAAGVNAT